MAKIKFKIKEGAKGQKLGDYMAKYKAEQSSGNNAKPLYKPKAKLTVHIKDGRK